MYVNATIQRMVRRIRRGRTARLSTEESAAYSKNIISALMNHFSND